MAICSLRIYLIIWILKYFVYMTFVIVSATRNEAWSAESARKSSTFDLSLIRPDLAGRRKHDPRRSTPSIFSFRNRIGQYLEMPRCQRNGALETSVFRFEFFTVKPDGMLLYFDDGGPSDYVELQLSRSKLILLFKFGAGDESQLKIGNKLSDSRWHLVSLTISGSLVRLGVDSNSVTEYSEMRFQNPTFPVSSCYLGGIPKRLDLERMSKSSVYFDTGFSGKIRRYAVNDRYQRGVSMREVSEDKEGDVCYPEANPCKNKGICYSRRNQPTCLCADTGFHGKLCDNVSSSAFDNAATFSGSNWFEYDLSDKQISSNRDSISLSFKTNQNSGMLLHTGMSPDFVTLSIKDGSVSMVANLGAGSLTVLLEPVNGTFSDNKWHYVKVNRELLLKKNERCCEGASVTSPITKSWPQSSSSSLFFPQLSSVCLWVSCSSAQILLCTCGILTSTRYSLPPVPFRMFCVVPIRLSLRILSICWC